MKKTILAIIAAVAMVCSPAANANEPDNYVYVQGYADGTFNKNVVIDENGEGRLYVFLDTYVEQYNTFAFNLYLPEGFKIKTNSRGKYIFTWNNADFDEVTYSHNMSYADKDGYVAMLAASLSNDYILPGNNWLFYITIVAPEGFNTNETAALRKVEFAEGSVKLHKMDDVEFIVCPATISGVENVVVDRNCDDEIYNLQGVRVKAPLAPGFYIINGEKVLVR